MPSIKFLSALGFILAAYGLYVEFRHEYDGDETPFVALCDIEAIGASCR
jgi:hypothetical protein